MLVVDLSKDELEILCVVDLHYMIEGAVHGFESIKIISKLKSYIEQKWLPTNG